MQSLSQEPQQPVLPPVIVTENGRRVLKAMIESYGPLSIELPNPNSDEYSNFEGKSNGFIFFRRLIQEGLKGFKNTPEVSTISTILWHSADEPFQTEFQLHANEVYEFLRSRGNEPRIKQAVFPKVRKARKARKVSKTSKAPKVSKTS